MKSSEELLKELNEVVLEIEEIPERIGYTHPQSAIRTNLRERYYALNEAITYRLKTYDAFYTNVSCLFAEGVEFMDKIELYNVFKRDFLEFEKELRK